MMCQIGDELHTNTSTLSFASTFSQQPSVLDLCMAPGGFTASVLKRNHNVKVCGISLPASRGGHKILLKDWRKDPRIKVYFQDITMLAAEMGVTEIPTAHPDAINFSLTRPFHGQRFDLVFCDGQVLRKHVREEYREKREAWRLLTSQLVLALQRVKNGGRIVVLLHKVDAWETVVLLHMLSKFSSLRLFKPVKKHATRSSFYAVADNVEPRSKGALQAVVRWKKSWHTATFGSDSEYEEECNSLDQDVDEVLSEFGGELIRLGQPVWEIQRTALRKAPFIQ
jgi:23S rRNA U2552 (ribose-2'-O)-methylase RlmE/FtsJ